MKESKLTEITGKTVIVNQTPKPVAPEIIANNEYLENMSHEANLAITTLRNFKPKIILVNTTDDIEYGLFETLQIDGISVQRLGGE